MTCAACQAHVEKAVKSVKAVSDVSVSLMTNSMIVTFADEEDNKSVCDAVSGAGYGASPRNSGPDRTNRPDYKKSVPADTETPKLRKRLVISLIFLVPMLYISMGAVMWGWYDPTGISQNPLACAVFQLLLTVIIMVVNQKFFINGFRGLLNKSPNMDSLVAIGSSAAFIYSVWHLFGMTSVFDSQSAANYISPDTLKEMMMHHLHELYFESAATILTLITVGKTLEAHSKGKAADALKSLMELAPETAVVVRDGVTAEISADEMVEGDIFIVKPGERIPADGIVTEGESAVDESALTGESIPADKTAGSRVSAATINKNGVLTCKATNVSGNTTIDRIIELVENASATKAPIAKTADKVSGIFVPAVIVTALVTGIIWLVTGHEFGTALERAVSVLVISCPCALGLATPVAIMVGSGKASKNGILFKTASSLEAAGKTEIAVLDKTGTVTEGKPKVTDIITFDNVSEKHLLETACALESKSEHPLAKAITERAEESGISLTETSGFRALTGSGVEGMINGVKVTGGNAKLMESMGLLNSEYTEKSDELSLQGKTPLYFAEDDRILGIIAVSDTIRKESREAVKQFEKMGIEVVMLTGDNRRTALAIAEQAGIKHVVSDVLPDGKEKTIAQLSKYGKTLMIGDGINDAPALTRADTGMAIGAGADVAVESADVVLVNSSLSDACAAVRMSRQTLKNIRENLFWAFFYNCIGIPFAAGVFIPLFNIGLNPMFAAAAMSLSSFCVVTNALRLNLFDPHSEKNGRSLKKKNIIPDDFSENVISGSEKGKNSITKTLYLEGMMCQHCVNHVKKALESLDGVVSADVSLDEKKAVMTLEKEVGKKIIFKTIRKEGYKPVSID